MNKREHAEVWVGSSRPYFDVFITENKLKPFTEDTHLIHNPQLFVTY